MVVTGRNFGLQPLPSCHAEMASMKMNFIKVGIPRISVDGFENLPQSEKINYDNKRGIAEE